MVAPKIGQSDLWPVLIGRQPQLPRQLDYLAVIVGQAEAVNTQLTGQRAAGLHQQQSSHQPARQGWLQVGQRQQNSSGV